MPEPTTEPAPSCPWCGAPAALGATRCSACGAAIAQRESIGNLRIAGLTSVDPALEDFDKRPLHISGPSPTQGTAPALIIGAVAGGPIGLAAIGGVAALAAAEYMGTKMGGRDGVALDQLGNPTDLMLQALEHADDAILAPAPPVPMAPDAAAADNGMSIWSDLPAEVQAPDLEPRSAPESEPEPE